ncbi:MAG TPA: ribosome biogenesis GTP-binding protein YihA/YsxC [Patescibacteria group bacterium]|nr:ribosome biogenesis GTP-binding protein YihA/YsxC [Patescibacteria group bacterium]
MNNATIEAVYVKSINGTDEIIEDNRAKVTFIGRSNVGKSSLINSLVGRQIARSSSRPGKTVKLDFFLVEQRLFFVDLPGYGYAKRSKESLEHYRKLIAWYLFRSGVNHKLTVLIIDAKVGLTDYDRESISLLTQHNIPFVIVANKVDKLTMSERPKQLSQIRKDCGAIPVIVYSSKTLEGRDVLVSTIIQQ